VPHLQPIVTALDKSIRGAVPSLHYAKVTNLAEGSHPELLDWIKQAGRTPGWK
jgi:hypothetical protein